MQKGTVVIFLRKSRTPVFFTQTKRGLIMNTENEEVIDLTEMVEKPSEGRKDDNQISDDVEKEAISLDTTALEEEEIVELVDAGEKDEKSGQDIFVEEVSPEKDLERSETPVFKDDKEDMGISVDFEDGDSEGGLIPTDFEGDLEPDMEASDGSEIPQGQDVYSKDDEQQVMPSQVTSEAMDTAVLEGLSDEKLEAIVTRVVKQTIEEKAERILLEVAEAAVAKEVEKIKQAL
jgi:DNA-binding transcriptional ArsR family regulator